MTSLNPITIATQGKGVLGMLKRAETIRRRYGLTPGLMERTLAHFVSLLREFDCGATFPITTVTLARSRGVVDKYQAEKIEFAAHGYFHQDQTQLSFNQQLEQFSAARRLFQERGIRCDGFRSPYLRSNPETLVALKQAGFAYDSSQALAWEVPEQLNSDAYARALEFYGAVSSRVYPALPRWLNNLVRIPYCLPDDEAMVDRFQTSPSRMTELWLFLLRSTYSRGELFTLALHPERVRLCQTALVETLRQATQLKPHVWMTQLYRIVEWWKARTEADINIQGNEQEGLHLTVHGPEGITILARHVDVLSKVSEWDGDYFQVGDKEIRFRSPRRPFIAVSPESPAYLTAFLRQQGYIVEITGNGANHSLYLDRPHFAFEDERPLLDQIEQGRWPLVRLGRWPNGARSALCVTGDIDALTIWDYALRMF